MIKVLFLVRPDLYKVRAGDTIQILSLRSALLKRGLKIEISFDQTPDLQKYDLVHCFNLLRVEICLAQCRWVKKQKKPLLLTPIYWNMEEYLMHERPDILKYWNSLQKKRKKVFELTDLVITNSEMEWQKIKVDFQIDLPHYVVYNGVDPIFYSSQINQEKKDILSVGRIHSRKNQLSLIKALQGVEWSLNLIGTINDPNYYRKCRVSSKNIRVNFLEWQNQLSLVKYYRNSKVHVLTSWYDTPGLVNLEAGLAGCNLVTTDRGTAKEYLGSHAFYCDPTNIDDIREKVIQAHETSLNKVLSHHIYENYLWDKIAQKAETIYTKFLTSFI